MESSSSNLSITAEQLAQLLGAELRGEGSATLSRLDTLETATSGSLTFVRDAKYLPALATTGASAALVPKALSGSLNGHSDSLAILLVDDTDLALIAILGQVAPKLHRPSGRHESASIDPSATVDASAKIGAHVSIGPGSSIGADVVLHPGVRIGAEVSVGIGCELFAGAVVQDRCVLGERVVIHPNTVIGADGFGYRPSPDNSSLIKVPHAGRVVIEDDVEIGANTTIDRAKIGDTLIGTGSKIDNLVQIGHNCTIGRMCIICGCCGVSGSVTLGDGVTLAGGVGIADGVTIGAGAQVGARSGVREDIPPGEKWFGYPARPGRKTFRVLAATEQLAELLPKLTRIVRDDKDRSAPRD